VPTDRSQVLSIKASALYSPDSGPFKLSIDRSSGATKTSGVFENSSLRSFRKAFPSVRWPSWRCAWLRLACTSLESSGGDEASNSDSVSGTVKHKRAWPESACNKVGGRWSERTSCTLSAIPCWGKSDILCSRRRSMEIPEYLLLVSHHSVQVRPERGVSGLGMDWFRLDSIQIFIEIRCVIGYEHVVVLVWPLHICARYFSTQRGCSL
jgi:hypothetical protein